MSTLSRRFFLRGATASIIAGFSKTLDAATPTAATPAACPTNTIPSPSELERLIKFIRAELNAQGLLHTKKHVMDFHGDMVRKYVALFGNDSVFGVKSRYGAEIKEAETVLNDPGCYNVNPQNACQKFEAWKFYRHLDALRLFPADGSKSFNDLNPRQQHYICSATTAYGGMVLGLYKSLSQKTGLEDKIRLPHFELYMHEISLLKAIQKGTVHSPCGRRRQAGADASPELTPLG